MANGAILVGWTRAQVGREQVALAGFAEYAGYLASLVRESRIEGFEPVFTRPHGGDLNGFILVKGDVAKLAALRESDQWKDWEIWGAYNLAGFGSIDCITGDGITDALGRWAKVIAG